MGERQQQFEVLNNVDHGELRVVTDRGAVYGDAVMQVMAFPFEFRNLQAHYPIFFQTDRNNAFYPVALLGFEEGENLFLEGTEWQAAYVPAMLRREPFMVGVKNVTGDGGTQEQARLLSIDVQHPRVSREAGEPLFKPLGGRTPFLEEQADLLETLHDGLTHCQAFTQALQEAELLEAVTLEITLNDGSRNQLIGLYGIDEDKVQQLSGDTLSDFNARGFLMPLFMVLASMANMRTLIDLKNRKVQAGV